jgi:hypothetical protein
MCLTFLVVIIAPFKVLPCQVYVMGAVFLPLLELIFWSHVGWSAFVPEFQGHPVNDALIIVISVLKTSRNHKGSNWAVNKGSWWTVGMFWWPKIASSSAWQ